MDKMTEQQDREKFLYLKDPKDYKLNYHQKVQEGRSKSTLRERPQLKLGKYCARDKVSEFKDVFKILNDRDEKMKAEQAFWYIKTFDQYYDHMPILKWFEFDDGKVSKMSKKHSMGTQ